MLQKLKKAALVYVAALLFASASIGVGLAPVPAYAAPSKPVNTDPAATGGSGSCADANGHLTENCDLLTSYVKPFITFLTALVGLAVVISIVIGGIQYGQSGGDPSKITAAKNRIRNAIVALVTFLLLDAGLNFLIPGGLF
jgi:hypothetical protein